MEYIARIIREQKIENRLFWKYDFLDIQNNKEDWFLSSCQINYLPNFAGSLKLLEDNEYKFFQSFNQIDNVFKEYQSQSTLIQQEREFKESIEGEENNFVKRKKPKLTPWEIKWLRRKLSWKEIREFWGVSEWTIRRWKKEKPNQPKKKRGCKLRISGNILNLLLTYYYENNTFTQQEMADYLSQKTGQKFDQSVISRTLKRNEITHKKATVCYSEQKSQMEKIENFVNSFVFISPFSDEGILALDECSFHLNEAPRYAYSRKGFRASVSRPGNKGSNYTLIHWIQNIKEKGVIHYQLVEGSVKSQTLHDFLRGINLPANYDYCLWLDNASVHRAIKTYRELGLPTVKEQLIQKKIFPYFLPPYTPQLNPVELCFNIIRQYVEKNRPRTFEELKKSIDEAINILNQKDLTEYFNHCLRSCWVKKF